MNAPIQRIRLETRIRLLTVLKAEAVTPHMRRITLGGAELEGFQSPGYADHVKVFIPQPGSPIVRPDLRPEGLYFPEDAPRPAARDYTPRRHDPVAQVLELDFVLHGDGPASGWASTVRVGDAVLIGGPRGSLLIPDDFDWYLLVGDETALPAIGRRLEELPEGARAIALIEVAEASEEQSFAFRCAAAVHYIHRNGQPAGTPGLLEAALARLDLPDGQPYCFVAAEGAVTRGIRRHLVEQRGYDMAYIRASGYWLRDIPGATEGGGPAGA